MKSLRALALLAATLVIAIPAASLASPFFLELAGAVAAATGYSAHNPNIRGPDGKLLAAQLSTSPQGAEVYIADNTGETLTTPTDAVIKSATLSLCAGTSIRGSTTICTPADGSITLKRSGLYRATYCINNATVTAAATITLKLFRKDGAESVAEESPRLRAQKVAATGETVVSLCTSGLLTVTAAQAAAAGGQVFDVRATASGGNIVVDDYRFSIFKVDELDPAQP